MLVVLWGAFVSNTGSGAGCGEHWPLCQGEVIPPPKAVATLIEFSHRLSSGVALLLVIGLVVAAFRIYPAGHRVRYAAGTSLALIILEALIGAALVLRGWVAFDVSVARVIIQPLHLVNTLFLLAALTLTAWWASGGAAPYRPIAKQSLALFGIGLIGIALIGGTGALISLGDLLALALGERYDAIVAWLVGLRAWHPALAIGVGLYLLGLIFYAPHLRASFTTRRLAYAVAGLVLTQWLIGALNVFLRVPLWTQMLHLFVADLIWIALILWVTIALSETPRDNLPIRAVG